MFLRYKRRKGRDYLVLVENYRDGSKVRQRTILNFGLRERLVLSDVNQKLASQPGFAFLNLKRPKNQSSSVGTM